ncbi:hypothetical protein IWQ61_008579 [Dispira simplex]|nr:hypothetical protein IWQ61_008579 [Dispira simplex]
MESTSGKNRPNGRTTSKTHLAPLAAVQTLRRQLLQMVPVNQLTLTVDLTVLTSEDFQRQVATLLLTDRQFRAQRPAPDYLRRFLKWYLDRVERTGTQALDEALLDLYLQLLVHKDPGTSPPATTCYKTYTLANNTVGSTELAATVQEDQTLVAHGTTGLRTWEAGLRLAEYVIWQAERLVRGQPVLELGSGTGLVGIWCGLLGATSVTLSDYHPAVLDRLLGNVALNQPPDGSEPSTRVLALDWLEWNDAKAQTYRGCTVLGADLVYDPTIIPALVRVLQSLARVECTIVIASTLRNPQTFAGFQEALVEAGLEAQVMTDIDEAPRYFYHDQISQLAEFRFLCIKQVTMTCVDE